jgi:hypothetical protein
MVSEDWNTQVEYLKANPGGKNGKTGIFICL